MRLWLVTKFFSLTLFFSPVFFELLFINATFFQKSAQKFDIKLFQVCISRYCTAFGLHEASEGLKRVRRET